MVPLPGTGNLANSLVLVKSRLLEENLQPLIYPAEGGLPASVPSQISHVLKIAQY